MDGEMDPARRDAILSAAADRIGTPAYVFFADEIAARADRIATGFGGRFALSYAVKSNPNPDLLATLRAHVPYLDISSIGEMRLGRQAGWDPARMSFTGPGKRDAELEEAIAGGVGELIVESVDEARRADRIAGGMGRTQPILIRVAPDYVPKGFGDQMAGKPSPFGIDYETAAEEIGRILALDNLACRGLHIYSGTQCLVPEAICENYRQFLKIFREICAAHDLTPGKLVFGSGLGIPYHAKDTALDLDAVAAGIGEELDAFRAEPRFGATELILELGRYLVGPAGYFLTRVITTKTSRGVRIGICDGGMNNHLPASGHFGMVIHRNYVMHKVGAGDGTGDAAEKINLVGPLCTSIDRLANGIELPPVAPGDVIAVHMSGAYGLTASPIHFISHAPPREILVEGGQIRDVTRSLSDPALAGPGDGP